MAPCLQALDIFKIVRGNFPDADVFSSTFDNYTEALLEVVDDLNLPVFTEEIGDTWIYGAPLRHSSQTGSLLVLTLLAASRKACVCPAPTGNLIRSERIDEPCATCCRV